MRGFFRLAWTNMKLYVREPVATFFTIAFPPLLVVLFGSIFGNEPSPDIGGYGAMDYYMPNYTALVLGMVALTSVPIMMAENRDRGVLRRFRATPVHPAAFIGADVVCNLSMTLLGVAELLLVGMLVFGADFFGSVPVFVLAVVLSTLSMFSIGYLIGSVVPNARTATVVGMVLLYPMMFLSGSVMPPGVLPEGVQRVAGVLPLTHIVSLLRGLWFGEPLGGFTTDIAVIVGVLIVGAALSARLFRWE